MSDPEVQELFREAIATNDAGAMRQGLMLLLGLDQARGLSPAREYERRRPDFVMEMPQSGERVRGRDAMRELQRNYPGGGPSVVLRRVVGAGRVFDEGGLIRKRPATTRGRSRHSSGVRIWSSRWTNAEVLTGVSKSRLRWAHPSSADGHFPRACSSSLSFG